MNKPGCHRTGLDAHFGGGTSMLRNASRNWPGIGGADTAPEPLALLVDNADRGRLLRYVRPNIMRHRNLRWCKPPGKMPGSRHYRLLGFAPRLPEVHIRRMQGKEYGFGRKIARIWLALVNIRIHAKIFLLTVNYITSLSRSSKLFYK